MENRLHFPDIMSDTNGRLHHNEKHIILSSGQYQKYEKVGIKFYLWNITFLLIFAGYFTIFVQYQLFIILTDEGKWLNIDHRDKKYIYIINETIDNAQVTAIP